MRRIGDADAQALLALLDDALEPENVAPSPAERAQLRAALADSRSTVSRPHPAGRRVPMRLRLAVVAVGVASILAAFALTRPLPTPIRSVAHGVGLPVDSVELAAARREMGDLEAALAGDDARAVEHAVEAVRNTASRLDRDEHREIDERLARLLDDAHTYLTEHAEPGSHDVEGTDGQHRESPSTSLADDHGTVPAPSEPAGGADDEPANTDDSHQQSGPTATTTPPTSGQDMHDGTNREHDDSAPEEPNGM
jgi:hypothetical protein